MNEREPILVISGLSRRYVKDDVLVEVCIFRLEGESEWSLDAYLEGGDCVAWDNPFPTEHDALAAFFRAMLEFGPSTFVARAHA